MKYYLISDNQQTLSGLRLSGIRGELADTPEKVRDALGRCLGDAELGVLIVTEKVKNMCREEVDKVMLDHSLPLVVEIPGVGGFSPGKISMLDYIREAIGLKL